MAKNLKTILLGLGALAVVGVIAIILVIGFLGFVPGVSDTMGTNKPRDLGVKYTQADYTSGLAKMAGHTVTNAEDLCLTCDYTSTGSVVADNTFTQEEFTAQVNKMSSKKGPLKDVQVKFNADGTIETSAMVNDPRLTAPVYVKGKLDVVGPREVIVKVDYAEAGRVGVTGEQAQQAGVLANRAFAEFFTKNPGLSIESLEVVNGAVKFKGTFPEQITGDPNSVARQLG